jgi:hypothetical protein
MPTINLRQSTFNKIVEAGHYKDLHEFLAYAVNLAITEEVKQIPKSSESPGSLSFTSIPAPAPTVTSDSTTGKPSQKKRKVTKPKPVRDPTFTMKGTFRKTLTCDRCMEQFSNRDEFDLHLPCSG